MSHHGVVDTAAEGGLVGSGPLKTIEHELLRHSLQVKWIPKRSQGKGVGGSAQVEGTVLIPIGIAGVNGVLECTAVYGDVPLLLPVRMFRVFDSLIDLKRGTMILQTHGRVVDLHELPRGHITIGIFSFASREFIVPEEVGTSEEFELATLLCFATVIPAQSCEAKFDFKSDTCLPTTHVDWWAFNLRRMQFQWKFIQRCAIQMCL